MANRVLILEIGQRKEGEDYRVLAFYTINPLITVGSNPPVTVIPTPSDALPSICDEYDLVPQTYKTQLDAGAAMFQDRVVRRRPGQTEQDLLQLVENKYAAMAARTVADLRRRYERTGTWAVDL